jgi:hypothetical protein
MSNYRKVQNGNWMQKSADEKHKFVKKNHVHACGIQTRHLIARMAQDRALIMIDSFSA